MDLFKILGTIAIDGLDSASDGLNKISDKAKTVGQGFSNAGSKISSVGMSMTKGIAAAGVAVAGGVTAVTKFAESASAAADNVDKMSQKIGISREAYQELDFICSQSGTSVDSLRVGMKTLTNVLADAQQASISASDAVDDLDKQLDSGQITLEEYNEQYDKIYESANKNAEALKELGFTFQEIEEMSPEDALFNVIQKLQEMPDDAHRAALAQDLLGKSAQELAPLLNSGVGSIDEMKQKAHDLGLVMSDETIDAGVKLTDTIDQAKRSFSAVAVSLGSELMPYVQKFAEYVIAHMPEIRSAISKVVEVFRKIVGVVKSVIEWFQGLDDKTKKIIVTIAAVIAAAGPILTIVGGIISLIGTLSTVLGFLLSPIGLVVAAIAAVIAIGVLLYKNWDTIKEKASELKEKISETFSKIKDTIKEKIDSAKETVRSAIEKIKGFFNFSWSLPKIKLPHFKISGKFSLDPPSIPKFSVDWYKKAMNNPMIMNKPTAFGINSMGQIMAGGEAGAEVVSGTSTLMNMIRQAVNEAYDTNAIADAIKDGLSGFEFVASVKVEPDDRRLFKVVENQARIVKKSTGREVFA